ncbi:glycosyltransferase [Oculatella sp. LEGE 06141]
MVPYLEEEYDVTVVYRKILNPEGLDHNYLTIVDETHCSPRERLNTNSYFSPADHLRLWKYKKVLARFAEKHANDFDLILEKEWPLLGLFSSVFKPYNVPNVLLAEAVYKFSKQPPLPAEGSVLNQWVERGAKVGFEQACFYLRKQWSRQANGIVAETDQLKSFFLDYEYTTPEQPVYPIPYGVNVERFYPQSREACRQQLGIPLDQFVFTYVGSLNRFIQEPAPLIEALGREQLPNAVFHIVGDGGKRHELEAIARQFNAPVVFHGRVAQREVPLHIGAANICVAPYNKSLYLNEKFTCASLKIPEYLACGRPVLTIPCERMDHLLDGQTYGFLVENRVEHYQAFLQNLPNAEMRSEMEAQLVHDLGNSTLKSKNIVLTWRDIADMHKQVIEERLAPSRV